MDKLHDVALDQIGEGVVPVPGNVLGHGRPVLVPVRGVVVGKDVAGRSPVGVHGDEGAADDVVFVKRRGGVAPHEAALALSGAFEFPGIRFLSFLSVVCTDM